MSLQAPFVLQNVVRGEMLAGMLLAAPVGLLSKYQPALGITQPGFVNVISEPPVLAALNRGNAVIGMSRGRSSH